MPDVFPTSPADGTHIYDDFLSNDGVTDGLVGELNWEMAAIGTISVVTFVASQNGIVRFTTASNANGNGTAFRLKADSVVLAGTNQMFRFRARIPDITGNVIADNNFRIGLGDNEASTDHAVGVWVGCDGGVISFKGASTNGDITQAAANVAGFTSGTTLVLGTWYDFAVFMEGTNDNGGPKTLKFYVDGTLAGKIENFLLGDTETMEPSIVPWQDQGGAQSYQLDIAYVEYWVPRNYPTA